MSHQPLILTLKMDDDSQDMFNRLRERHFPKKRNFIPAHLSLFNQLPGNQLESIVADVEQVCRAYGPLTLRATRLLFLGKGVGWKTPSWKPCARRWPGGGGPGSPGRISRA